MLSAPDAQMALSGAQDNDLAQRKLQMDALRGRLGDQRDQKEKLREACEGFESIFLQRMWEQMRATVPDEGYLHSKEEKFWQSMFDQELSKKMASAGGVGLGDMLFDQLAVTLLDASRVNTPSQADHTVPVKPLHDVPQTPAPLDPLSPRAATVPSASDLYTPLDENQAPSAEVDTTGGLYNLASAVAAFDVNEANAAEAVPAPEVVAADDVQAPIIIPAPTQPAAPRPLMPQSASQRSSEQSAAPQEPSLRPGVAPLDEGNHEAIMRRLAEIAYAARAPQADINQLSSQATAAEISQSEAAKLLTEETAASAPREDVMDRFTSSRLGGPERVRTPQHSAVADAPIVQRAANAAPAPRMQHPSIQRGAPTEEN